MKTNYEIRNQQGGFLEEQICGPVIFPLECKTENSRKVLECVRIVQGCGRNIFRVNGVWLYSLGICGVLSIVFRSFEKIL